MYLHLFDSLVKPIILYACEAWADSLKYDRTLLFTRKHSKKSDRKIPGKCTETITRSTQKSTKYCSSPGDW